MMNFKGKELKEKNYTCHVITLRKGLKLKEVTVI